jgi:ABC-type cobalamin/Fe3+-siderophores transport system ATPase subunit
MFEIISQNLYPILDCIKVSIEILWMFPLQKRLGLLIIPVITSLLNIHINTLFVNHMDAILLCVSFKIVYDFITWFVQNNIFYVQVRNMQDSMLLRLNMAKLHCGVSIPGVNQKQHKDLLHDKSKLGDFLFVLPMIWSTIVNFSITIYKMDSSEIYPIKTLFAFLCIGVCGYITYMTDPTVYEKTKPNATSITRFDDSQFVKTKLSMGCVLDTDFEKQKRIKIEKQRELQKFMMLYINVAITFISLINKNVGQLHAFGNISWMIGALADNIKSLQYYSYTKEFIDFTKCLESHKLDANGSVPVNIIDKITFVNTTFGYYDDDLMKKPTTTEKIKNLSHTFKLGELICIKASNGNGKSTLFKMISSNLFSGDIFFGNINRKNLSFADIQSSIFHLPQASEYTPKFSKDEINSYKDRDFWLEEKLGLSNLFEKDSVEMSGGERQRMSLYISLTSKSTVILLDEILSEMSSEETSDIPEGGGWLCRVINTLVDWQGRKNKIIVLVGHGVLDLIPNKKRVIKLKLYNEKNQTILSSH